MKNKAEGIQFLRNFEFEKPIKLQVKSTRRKNSANEETTRDSKDMKPVK